MNKTLLLQYFSYGAACALLVSLFLLMAVIYFLRKINPGYTNQKLLIMNVSLAELCLIPSGVLYYLRIPGKTQGTLAYELTTVAFAALALNCYLSTTLVIIDRSIAAAFPLRYRVLLSPQRVKVIAIVLWSPSLTVPIPYFILGYEKFIALMITISLCLDAIMLLLAIHGYAYIYVKIRRRRRIFQNQNESRRIGQEVRVFKVAFPIILSFLLLVTVPDVVALLLSVKGIDPLYFRKLLYTVSSLDILVDPMLFFYQYPPLRSALLRKLGVAAASPPRIYLQASRHRDSSNSAPMSANELQQIDDSVVCTDIAVFDTKL